MHFRVFLHLIVLAGWPVWGAAQTFLSLPEKLIWEPALENIRDTMVCELSENETDTLLLWEFDEKSNLTRTSYRSATENDLTEIRYQYDSLGRVSSDRVLSDSWGGKETDIRKYHYVGDQLDRITWQRKLNLPPGVEAFDIKYHYDETGLLKEECKMESAISIDLVSTFRHCKALDRDSVGNIVREFASTHLLTVESGDTIRNDTMIWSTTYFQYDGEKRLTRVARHTYDEALPSYTLAIMYGEGAEVMELSEEHLPEGQDAKQVTYLVNYDDRGQISSLHHNDQVRWFYYLPRR